MKIKFKNVTEFTTVDNQKLWDIFTKSYDLSFYDFTEKQKTLDKYALYFNSENQLIGYTGIRDCSFKIEKKNYRAIYFGQTVIEKEYRGKNLIQNTVIKLLAKHFIGLKQSKLIIWNDSLSYRPYLVMAKNLKNYYPNKNLSHKAKDIEIRNTLGNRYYKESFCSSTGTVFKDQVILKENELTLSSKDLNDPHIQYYVSLNPNYEKGHGLITFCHAEFGNLFYYLKKRIAN